MSQHYQHDVLVIGSGAAGLTLALTLPAHLRIAVLSKGDLANGSTLVKLESLNVTGVVKGHLSGEVGDAVRVTLQSVNVEKGWIDLATARDQSVDGFLLKG